MCLIPDTAYVTFCVPGFMAPALIRQRPQRARRSDQEVRLMIDSTWLFLCIEVPMGDVLLTRTLRGPYQGPSRLETPTHTVP